MNSIKLLSWNILGAQASDLELMQTKYSDIINWPKKCNQLISKIISYDVDIICLQEIDMNTKRDFECVLKRHGFQVASYEPKNSNGGTLILYKTEKFNCIDHNGISLKINAKLGACAWAILENKQTLQTLFVTSIHVHWQFQKEQLKILVQSLNNRIAMPTIIAGDFNIPYVTMIRTIIPYLHDLNLVHPKKIKMFEHSSWTTQSPHHQKVNCWESLDHVLFSNNLKLDESNSFIADSLNTYQDDKVKTMTMVEKSYKESIPNGNYPSDHLPVIVSFTF